MGGAGKQASGGPPPSPRAPPPPPPSWLTCLRTLAVENKLPACLSALGDMLKALPDGPVTMSDALLHARDWRCPPARKVGALLQMTVEGALLLEARRSIYTFEVRRPPRPVPPRPALCGPPCPAAPGQ